MGDNKVSILIPVYNREELIGETIKSAQNQTYENVEIIIVDNCSKDNTYEIVEYIAQCDNRVKLFRNKENLGPVLNWTECLKKVSGEYIKILWSDDLIHKDFIKKCVNILESNQDCAFVYTKTQVFFDNGNNGQTLYNIKNCDKVKKEFFIENLLKLSGIVPVSPGCALFRKKDVYIDACISSSNNINHNKSGIGADALIFMYALKSYKNVYYLNETLSFFRSHKGSITVSSNLNDLLLQYADSFKHFLDKNNTNEYESYYKILINTITKLEVKRLISNISNKYNFVDNLLSDCINSFYDVLYNKPKRKLDNVLNEVSGKKIGIYGAGEHTFNLLKMYENIKGDKKAEFYIFDSNPNKINTKILGITIYNPKEINNLNLDRIIISSYAYQEDIYKTLSENISSKINIIKIYDESEETIFDLFKF